MQVSEILDGAADKIERDGWCQHASRWGSETCMLGAIWAVSGTALGTPELAAMTNALGMPLPKWNDAPDRTKAEVIAMLRAVAATERARAAVTVVQPERERVE